MLGSSEVSRCTGHCCRSFHLPHSPDGIKAKFMNLVKRKSTTTYPKDIDIIHSMLIYQGFKNVNPLGESMENPGHYYTCHHLADNGDCLIYEQRPEMCREYPAYAGGMCEFPGCTFKVDHHGTH